ncbi:MAG: hypothetical protein HYR63_09505 [Proteobacteria bacterium]|nr:hypothetical protein [Pseudomonadota bacterium]MBI3497549.1 hypothetical protein [Pseudomonadota bacterium]
MGPGRFGNERNSRSFRLLRWGALVLLAAGIGLFAFQLGVEDERGRNTRLTEDMARLAQANQRLDEANRRLATENKAALSQLAELGDRLANESSSGVPRELIQGLRRQLDAGIDPQRLAALLAAVGPVGEECEPPEIKRFLVRTPIAGERPGMSVGFAGGTLTLSAQGAATRNAEGRQEAWFDPGEPVTVKFAEPGGRGSEAAGKLPLQHAVVVGQTRHRFALSAGPRGFIQVSAERCKVK